MLAVTRVGKGLAKCYPMMCGARAELKVRFLSWVVLALTCLSMVAPPAQAFYDQHLSWSDMSDFDLRPAFRSQYASQSNLLEPSISDSTFELVLRDADDRVSEDFTIPDDLRNSVGFWLRVYTEWTTHHVAIFDSRHPEIVYEVLDFRELSKTARNAIVYEIVSKKKIKNTLAAYRKALAKLAAHPGGKHPGREEQNILKAIKRARHKHSIKELAHNVRSQTGQRDNIVKGLLAAEAFFPKMEQLFRQVGTPPELTRLALVESSFNLHATSRVGAAGVWQFMKNPGYKYMLIDQHANIDERLSPLKSTVAAARLLKENFQRFRNWPLSVTSYNHGLRGLLKFGKKKESEYEKIAHLFDPCKRSPLGWAGRNYYAEFLAVLHAEAYRKVFYGEPPVSNLRPVVFRKSGEKTALAIAMSAGVSLHEFKLLNPDILNINKPLPRNFLVAIPGDVDDMAGLIGKKPTHLQAKSSRKVRDSEG